jgi:hypothetical protein
MRIKQEAKYHSNKTKHLLLINIIFTIDFQILMILAVMEDTKKIQNLFLNT